MSNPNPNAQPQSRDGKDGSQSNPWDKLKGQRDANGVPLHPDEKADYYKQKSDDSNREANKIIEQNKSLSAENEQLKTPVPPVQGNAMNTANDLASKIPNWNALSTEQQTAMLNSFGTLHSDLETIKRQVAEMVDKQDFDKGYNALIQDPQFSKVADFKEEFIAKSYEQDNLKTPLKILATAFLAEKGLWGAKANDKPNGDEGLSGLDTGSGGDQTPPTSPNTYSSVEAAELRQSDPKKYARLIREKKLTIKD